ncbi:DUF4238 domain-containing protein [Aminobacter niigataensis]|uniref:DUF4238 domain-containing protein n=1 Tax=Aminobacter niigataensis TaxID=83265 RepID=UPI0024C52DE0|nr:DUF4238 domain-containing protein [Aminobacter niigataensis]CAI2934351.1 conserved protein of unknown function [Aminobacter niigataensis]
MSSEPKFHHYLPSFHQSRWAGADGRVLRYRKVYGGRIHRKRVYPTESGGDEYLYSDPSKPPAEAQWVERTFMSPLDSRAHDALTMLENQDPRINHEARARSDWSRFLMSLMMRMPDDLATLRESLQEEWIHEIPQLEKAFQEKKESSDPATFAEYWEKQGDKDFVAWAIALAPTLIDHGLIGDKLNNMRWFIREISGDAEFLTSDRPLISHYDLHRPDTFIILPIGPKRAFVAVNNVQCQKAIEAHDGEYFVNWLNRLVVGAAKEFVFAQDNRHRELVERHFGDRPRTTLFEYLARFRRRRRQEVA